MPDNKTLTRDPFARKQALLLLAANPAHPVQWWRFWMSIFGTTGTIIIFVFLLGGLCQAAWIAHH
jgi:hypothetical protein